MALPNQAIQPGSKRVLVLLFNEFTNDSRVLKECTTLAQSGYDVELWCAYDPNLSEHEVVNQFIVRRVFFRSRFKFLRRGSVGYIYDHLMAPLYDLFSRQPSFDIVHCNDLLPLPFAAKLKAKNPKLKIVYDSHEFQTESSRLLGHPIKRLYLSFLEKKFISCADEVVTVSPSINDAYERLYGLDHSTVIRNFPERSQSLSKSGYFQERFKIGPQELIFLYLGGLNKGVRGLEEILAAFSQLWTEGFVNRHMVFMGDGPLRDEIYRISVQYKNIHYHPPIPPSQIPKIAFSADYGIIFLPNKCKSYYYSLPNKLFEYISCGLSIVTSPLFEIKKIIEEEKIGFVTKDFLRASLVDALKGIKEKPSEETRNRIFSLHQTKYNWKTEEEVLINLYSRL